MPNIKKFICLLVFLTCEHAVKCEEFTSGAEYLQTAIRDIVIKNSERNIVSLMDSHPRIVTGSPSKRVVTSSAAFFNGNRRLSGGDHQPQAPSYQPDYPPHDQHPQHQHIPEAPSLTKGELAALYEAAVSAGHSVHMTGPGQDSLPVQAALHEIRDTTHTQHGSQQDGDSYYYYYYPLKSFVDAVPNYGTKTQQVPKDHYKPLVTSYNTHMHNVKVEPIQTVAEVPGKGGKALEPLFMAISSFVGMAVMFMFSMVLLPRITGGIKGVIKGGGKGNVKNNNKNNNNNRNNNNRNNNNRNNNNRFNNNNSRTNFKYNNNNNRNNNNRNRNNNNHNNNRKGRIMHNFDGEIPHLIADFVDAFSCTTCADHKNLSPYKNILSRNAT